MFMVINEYSSLVREILDCRKCPLHVGRNKAVPGEGNINAKLMFIGEAPGGEEDVQGRPFVGRAGKLLRMILMDLGFKIEDVYITNVVKCRPPENRRPNPLEIEACKPYLEKQLRIIDPKIIVLLGNTARDFFFKPNVLERGKIFRDFTGRIYFYTYHPSACLRNPNLTSILKSHMEIIKGIYMK